MTNTPNTIPLRHIGVRDEFAPKFGRQVLTLWSGSFMSDFEGTARELPGHNGFMITISHSLWSHKTRVSCESPRNDENYERVDAAIEAALNAAEAARHEVTVAPQIDPYDQDTLDRLIAAGVDLALVERVNRMAKDSAAWKRDAEINNQLTTHG